MPSDVDCPLMLAQAPAKMFCEKDDFLLCKCFDVVFTNCWRRYRTRYKSMDGRRLNWTQLSTLHLRFSFIRSCLFTIHFRLTSFKSIRCWFWLSRNQCFTKTLGQIQTLNVKYYFSDGMKLVLTSLVLTMKKAMQKQQNWMPAQLINESW